jgi:hypothetical protein
MAGEVDYSSLTQLAAFFSRLTADFEELGNTPILSDSNGRNLNKDLQKDRIGAFERALLKVDEETGKVLLQKALSQAVSQEEAGAFKKVFNNIFKSK